MRWVLRLIATGDDARCQSTDLVECPLHPHKQPFADTISTAQFDPTWS
jgi:hypothetical protein